MWGQQNGAITLTHKNKGFLLINVLVLMSTWLVICQVLLKSCHLFFKSAKLAWHHTQCKELAYSALYFAKSYFELIPFSAQSFEDSSTFYEISNPKIAIIKLNKNHQYIYVDCNLLISNCHQRYKATYTQIDNQITLNKIQKTQ